ncbi:hypothetical protein ACIBCO_09940 [Streptomyces violascens]|uniref:hypothetical protein n=1 Tax=Streptomyces violascens TaxID=67381 RepID=UPI0037A3883A
MATKRCSTYRPRAGDRAKDIKHNRMVEVKTRPGVFAVDAVWVRPLSGGEGWLASCADLEEVGI